MQIIPSILVRSAKEFISQIRTIENILDLVQLDIADGKFVPNTTWADPDIVEKNANIDIELHLMVKKPLQELERWTATEQIKRVLIHYESFDPSSTRRGDLKSILEFAKQQSWEIGLVLNPDTPINSIEPYLSELQSIMFMGVYPGFQGQQLLTEVLSKIKLFKSKYPTIFTELDGAVNEKTLPQIFATGVDAICPGSAVFGNDRTPEENVKRMLEIINRLTQQ